MSGLHSTEPPEPPPPAASRVEQELRSVAEERDQPSGKGEERFRSFISRCPDGIVMVDDDGRIAEWNEGEERITGIPRAEALFQPIWDVQYRLAPEEHRTEEFRARARDNTLRGLQEGLNLRRVLEEEIQRPDGSRRIIQSLLLAIPSGEGICAGCVTRDVTERRRREEALDAANRDLTESDRKKNEFLAMLAHELRDPLGVISSAVQVLRAVGAGAPAGRLAAETVERQVDHMARLVDDLLDIGRVAQGKVVLKIERLPLSSVVDAALEAARPGVRLGAHRLSVTLPQEPLFLNGDRVRLTQVLANLLNNAAKFTPREGEISLSAWEESDQVAVSVRDSGRGIDPRLLPRVFEPFVQAEGSLREGGGLGIGLAVVRSLVEMHGGRVAAFSDGQGRGSEFVLRLPLAGPRDDQLTHPGQQLPKPLP